MGTVSEIAPSGVEADELVFRLADPEHASTTTSRSGSTSSSASSWRWPGRRAGGSCGSRLPDLDCLEYLFDVDGTMAPDPGNPDQVEGAFGPHSWLAMPGYRPPAWLDEPAAPGRRTPLTVGEIDVEVWAAGRSRGRTAAAAAGPRRRRDGRLRRGGPVRRDPAADAGRPAQPGRGRDERYAANPAYAAALVGEVRPGPRPRRSDDPERPVLLGPEPRRAGGAARGLDSPRAPSPG